MSAPRRPGDLLAPGYVVDSHLSRGNLLDVYAVWSSERDCLCIAKVLCPDSRGDASAHESLQDEGRLLTTLAHPHLVHGYVLLDDPVSGPIVVLETLTGATLSRLIESDFKTGMATGDVAQLGRQLCSGLHYLHDHDRLHLDLKPSNIVCSDGRAILIDLSLARPPGVCAAGNGTAEYMAPEQVAGGRTSAATDVWGLGGVLFRALTGRRPFPRSTADREPDHRPDFTALDQTEPHLSELVTACLSVQPSERPTLDGLRKVLNGLVLADSRS